MKNTRTQKIVVCALLLALLVVSAWFTIPIGSIPVTLQTLVVILIALLLEPKWAAVTTAVYLLMGTVGLPVFSGMTGGIIRTSSGFLFAYLIATVVASAVRIALAKRAGDSRPKRIAADVVAALLIIVIADILGWLWLAWFADMSLAEAFLAADAPFIFIDCCKAVVAIIIAMGIRKGMRWE